MRGTNTIIVTAEPRGTREEGVIATAEYPGTICERVPSSGESGGRFTYRVYQPGTDGAKPNGAYWVLLEDSLQGKTVNDAYVAGTRAFFYSPIAGEELNCLVKNVAGTADDHPIGEMMCVDTGTGKLIVAAGTEASIPFQLLEAITDMTADTLAHVQFLHP